MVKLASFCKPNDGVKHCYQTRQVNFNLMENANIKKFRCNIIGDFRNFLKKAGNSNFLYLMYFKKSGLFECRHFSKEEQRGLIRQVSGRQSGRLKKNGAGFPLTHKALRRRTNYIVARKFLLEDSNQGCWKLEQQLLSSVTIIKNYDYRSENVKCKVAFCC